MWTVVKVQGTEVLRGALDQWRAGVDAHEPEKVAAVFTEDAIFQGSVHTLWVAKASPTITTPNRAA
jgi:hypothetical protein